MKQKTIHIPEKLDKKVSELAEEQGRSQAEIMRNGIYNELQKYEK
jgi:predicted transcriptional regulator